VLTLACAAVPAFAAAGKAPVQIKEYTDDFAGWSDQLVSRIPTTAVTEFVTPAVSCGSDQSGISPSVAVAGEKYETYAAIEVGCDAGLPSYVAAIELNGSPLQEIKESTVKVGAGDTVRISITESAHLTSVTVHDLTSKTSKTETTKVGHPMLEAEIGLNGLQIFQNGEPGELLPIMKFRPVHFTDNRVDGHTIGTFFPYLYESFRTSNGKKSGRLQAAPTALSDKDDFAADFKGL
jgi:hypothetical protein